MPGTTIVGAAPAGRPTSDTKLATGAFVGDGNNQSLALGFNPRSVKIINETTGKIYEKLQGNSPNTCMVNGVADTTGLILFPQDAGLHEPGSSVLCAASMFNVGDKVAFSVIG